MADNTRRSLLAPLITASLCAACAHPTRSGDGARIAVSEPLTLAGSAFDAGARIALPQVDPAAGPGLQHVFRLSDNIVSGAEPEGPEALEQIASWGVKTILSVDGKVPDAETARSLGMNYVHVPIEYSGIDSGEILKITKTFRELEGPFFVHCFHGKHRGPAAAALGRIVLDGVPRERAIAEMRQWCATASKYEGLYSTVATASIPSTEESENYPFAFDSAHSFDGLRGAMVDMTRKWDLIKAARKNSWKSDPNHPDVVPLQEAVQLSQLFEATSALDETRAWPDDFRAWLENGRSGAAQLVTALETKDPSVPLATTSEVLAEVESAYTRISQSCKSCHAAYRN